MRDHHPAVGHRGNGGRVIGSSFVGSVFDGPGEARVALRDEIDTDALGRLGAHLDGVLDALARFITIEAAGVTGADPGIVAMLGDAGR